MVSWRQRGKGARGTKFQGPDRLNKLGKLSREFYLRDPVTVAKDLLGARLAVVSEGDRLVVEITETEAYAGTRDRACHSYGGRRTARTQVMYGLGGHAYVYLIYGMYDLFNVVTGAEEDPCAVLIRGGRPVEGRDAVARRRTGKAYGDLTARQRAGLLDGPGKLCRGLGITRAHNGADLLGDALYILPPAEEQADRTVHSGKRIGIDYAGPDADLPYRFWIE